MLATEQRQHSRNNNKSIIKSIINYYNYYYHRPELFVCTCFYRFYWFYCIALFSSITASMLINLLLLQYLSNCLRNRISSHIEVYKKRRLACCAVEAPIIPPPVGEAGFGSAWLRTYVRVCVYVCVCVCNNFAALWRDPYCLNTLV